MNEADWLASDDLAAMLRHLTRGQQWLSETHAAPVARPSDRKLRLFTCAVTRLVMSTGSRQFSPITRADLDTAERYADGLASADDLAQARVAGDLWCGVRDALAAASAAASMIASKRSETADLLRDIVGNPWRASVVSPEWRTTDVLALARAAYDERGDLACETCAGTGRVYDYLDWQGCPACRGTGRTTDGRLDPQRLAVLSDALEEAGVPSHEEAPCPVCTPCRDDPRKPWPGPGYHPERDPASGRHEGGWTNCKTCNGGGNPAAARPGVVRVPHPLLSHLRSPGPHARGCWALDLTLGKE